jgi:microcystin-dependent protein
VGFDNDNSEYKTIGNSGGLDKVRLTISQMPSHTHTDSGHVHYINFNSSTELLNTFRLHGTNDEKRFTRDPNGSIAEDMDPTTHSHAHDIKGNSNTGYSQLTLSGGSDEHENRPPYYVVAYIIFLG